MSHAGVHTLGGAVADCNNQTAFPTPALQEGPLLTLRFAE